MGAQSGFGPVLACYDALFERMHTDGNAEGCVSLINRMIRLCAPGSGSDDAGSMGSVSGAGAGAGVPQDTLSLGLDGGSQESEPQRKGGGSWGRGITGTHAIIERIIGFAPDAQPVLRRDSSSELEESISVRVSRNSGSHDNRDGTNDGGDGRGRSYAISTVLWPTASHWYYTIDCTATKRGGAEALRMLARMRQPHAVGGGELRPSQACYSSTISALIQDDCPELIGEALLMSRADGVVLSGSVLDGVRSMRRYDVVLETIEVARGRQ